MYLHAQTYKAYIQKHVYTHALGLCGDVFFSRVLLARICVVMLS